MPEIVLTREQVGVLAAAGGPVYVRGPDGQEYGSLDQRDADAIARHRRRIAAPRTHWYTHAQVMAQLDALEAERLRGGTFDPARLESFIAELQRTDPEKYGPTRSAA